MNVIAKISWYHERSVVTLKLRKEYLNTVTRITPVLLRIKYWTNWYIDRYSMSTYTGTGVTNFQKQSGFLTHPVHCEPKNTPKCFSTYSLQSLTDCDKIWYILSWVNLSYRNVNVFRLTSIVSLPYLVKLSICILQVNSS